MRVGMRNVGLGVAWLFTMGEPISSTAEHRGREGNTYRPGYSQPRSRMLVSGLGWYLVLRLPLRWSAMVLGLCEWCLESEGQGAGEAHRSGVQPTVLPEPTRPLDLLPPQARMTYRTQAIRRAQWCAMADFWRRPGVIRSGALKSDSSRGRIGLMALVASGTGLVLGVPAGAHLLLEAEASRRRGVKGL